MLYTVSGSILFVSFHKGYANALSSNSELWRQIGMCNFLSSHSPGTTRLPHDGEISGVDYNFVSIEEFFSLEESGALLESGKFKGEERRGIYFAKSSPSDFNCI